ncbi:hypothetical protein F2P56_027263 [Juglans regia]|uniref:Prefoldin subunit 3 n=2 Tax=Juglans regia TaxID=51240 RepID=A0A833TP96_JUGRE|nr:probable prefoldin subunit 3 [Juglans regia]KAF5452241.1 hypothetical protein F2P56_027263 [Juglans regia]
MASSTPGVPERRGIPGAEFVEDVQTYLTQSGLNVNSALAILLERLQQYKLVEMRLLAQQRNIQARIPDIEKCFYVVATLQTKKGTGIFPDFEVSEGIYYWARIEDNDSVCLWLEANVMLEYSCEEATALLQKNLDNAKASLEVVDADLQFLRDQATITQGNAILLGPLMGLSCNICFAREYLVDGNVFVFLFSLLFFMKLSDIV